MMYKYYKYADDDAKHAAGKDSAHVCAEDGRCARPMSFQEEIFSLWGDPQGSGMRLLSGASIRLPCDFQMIQYCERADDAVVVELWAPLPGTWI